MEDQYQKMPVLGGATLFETPAPAVHQILGPKDTELYKPLALNCHKVQHLPALVVYKHQSPGLSQSRDFLNSAHCSDAKTHVKTFLRVPRT